MKVRARLLALLFGLIGLFLAGTVALWRWESANVALIVEARQAESYRQVNALLKDKLQSLSALPFDFSAWDEMTAFVESSDRAWAKTNIDQAVASHGAQAAWVCRTDYSVVYCYSALPETPSPDLPLPAEARQPAFLRGRLLHFYAPTRDGLMEIRGTAIHPSTGTGNAAPVRGFFFVGRLWDQKYLDEISELTGGKATIKPASEIKAIPSAGEDSNGARLPRRKLLGWDGNPVGLLDIEVNSHQVNNLLWAPNWWFILGVGLSLALLALFSWALMRWVAVPLGKISTSLDNEDAARIDLLAKDRTEFGHIARLISQFFRQKSELVQEIAERKRAEEERSQLQGQLLQAQKMESVGRLAGGIAHDFNNLLSPILGYAEMGLMGLREEDPLYADLMQIRNAAERASSLIRGLLAFSRKQALDMKVLNLNDVVGEFEKMLRRMIGEDIDLLASLDPALGSVKVDRSQIEQILMNLAVNGRDAMPDGGKLIIETANVFLDEQYAKIHAGVESGSYVMLAVSDSGCGMDAETLSHVFEPFFTTKGHNGGTGLGLATVHGIVKQHGGHIWVYSEVGRGTIVKIYLPRVGGAPEDALVPSVRRDGQCGRETILVVEDEQVVRRLASDVLSSHGFEVIAAGDAEEALGLAEGREGPIHLLLTDVIMPRMNGKELHQRLASTHPGMKALFMSGYTEDIIAHHGILAPGIQFLQKPFSVANLTQRVRDVLDN